MKATETTTTGAPIAAPRFVLLDFGVDVMVGVEEAGAAEAAPEIDTCVRVFEDGELVLEKGDVNEGATLVDCEATSSTKSAGKVPQPEF